MFDNLCKSWPRGSQQCINRLKNKQTSYRVFNTVLIKVLYDRCGSWPQKCYGDGYSTRWLRHFIATKRYEFFNFRSAEARSEDNSINRYGKCNTGVFGGKPKVHRDFLERESPSGLRREKNQQQRQVRQNFKVFNNVDNRAKALDKKQETNFENMEIGGEKMRKSGQQGKNER